MKDHEDDFLFAVKMIDDTMDWNHLDRLMLYKAQAEYLPDTISQAVMLAYFACVKEPHKIGMVMAPLTELVRHRAEYEDIHEALTELWKQT